MSPAGGTAAEVMIDVRDHLLTLPGIQDAGVDIVYEPCGLQSECQKRRAGN